MQCFEALSHMPGAAGGAKHMGIRSKHTHTQTHTYTETHTHQIRTHHIQVRSVRKAVARPAPCVRDTQEVDRFLVADPLPDLSAANSGEGGGRRKSGGGGGGRWKEVNTNVPVPHVKNTISEDTFRRRFIAWQRRT